MGPGILSLYRSAEQPAMVEAGRRVRGASARPGLVISATEDVATGSEESRRRVAKLAGAEVAVLGGLGHWWMVQGPRDGARVLTEFWSRLSEVAADPPEHTADPVH